MLLFEDRRNNYIAVGGLNIPNYYYYYFFFVQDDTEVTVVWASHTSSDADSGLSKHTKTGILSGKHNLIKEALSAMQPKTTPPIPTDSAGVIGPYFACYIGLAWLSVYFTSF